VVRLFGAAVQCGLRRSPRQQGALAVINALDLRDVPDAKSHMPDSLDKWIEDVCEADPLPVDLDDDDDGASVMGPPLTPEEIQAARDRLTRWQGVKVFSADTKALCNRCVSSDFFVRPRLKFLHDAHVLAKFARPQCVDRVRLAGRNENWPDGLVEIGNRAFNIEVTSTHGDRKLGDEYRHPKGWRFDPVEDWEARANSIRKYLEEVISGKSKKNYSSPCWLVVYLNISEYGIRQPETEQVIAATKARYAAAFVNIAVLWKGKLY
jgi:hypothetical protein